MLREKRIAHALSRDETSDNEPEGPRIKSTLSIDIHQRYSGQLEIKGQLGERERERADLAER